MRCQHRREETECPYCLTSVAWAIVKDKEVRERFPHTHRWARLVLGLEDREEVRGTRHPHDPDGDVNV